MKRHGGAVMERLDEWSKRRISLAELENLLRPEDYGELVRLVEEAVAAGELAPVKSSRSNGKVPPLAQSYWVRKEVPVDTQLVEELRFGLHPALENGYYLAHLEQYAQDRADVLALNDFWRNEAASLEQVVSLNERSFQIFRREKFLKEGGGVQLLKNVGLSVAALRVYQTAEPLAYYARHKDTPQNVVIVENKDTFCSMRAYLLSGGERILGLSAGTLIYGGGKKVCRMMQELEASVEPYLLARDNVFYYFGDLDYEGLGIFESLDNVLAGRLVLKPFAGAYRAMVAKAAEGPLPATKAGQQRMETPHFWGAFTPRERAAMEEILRSRRYIPQEILTIADFRQVGK